MTRHPPATTLLLGAADACRPELTRTPADVGASQKVVANTSSDRYGVGAGGLFVGMNADPQSHWVALQGDSAVGNPALSPTTTF